MGNTCLQTIEWVTSLSKSDGLDNSPITCTRTLGHPGSHIATRRCHITIWDNEECTDFAALGGIDASVLVPIDEFLQESPWGNETHLSR